MKVMTITLDGVSVDIEVSESFFSMTLDEQMMHYIRPAFVVLNERIQQKKKGGQ